MYTNMRDITCLLMILEFSQISNSSVPGEYGY